ncbi:MAG: NAD-dependent epimerase/dehydratase family protein [Bosea sp. (in: a-proteobacteria)]
MKHIVFGGNGFVGTQLVANLAAQGEEVVVADLALAQPREGVTQIRIDLTRRETLDAVPMAAGDMVYNLAAKMLSPLQVRAKRYDFFYPVNFHGVENILDRMQQAGAHRLVQFTTDMIYGHTHDIPKREDARKEPLGHYGGSKLAAEQLCERWRAENGFNISIFRPRLIIGPGRLGILAKLFKLIDLNLPVPMIGAGKNPYQFISVYDCASAAEAGWRAGVPNRAYNLGSTNPPSVKQLLGELITEAGSKSVLLPTPAPLVKMTLALFDRLNLPIMDPEQYLIADETCILDTSAALNDLGWQPQHRDSDMLRAAYREYRAGLTRPGSTLAASVA